MLRLTPSTQPYAWGSTTAIPDLLGTAPDGGPVAEAWFGAHPSAPAVVAADAGAPAAARAHRRGDHRRCSARTSWPGSVQTLPYLLKVIAAERPLSLQVHPNLERARAGHAEEDAAGVPLDAPHRNYRDHEPQARARLRADAVRGDVRVPGAAARGRAVRRPRRAARQGAARRPARRARRADGIRTVFEQLLDPATRPGADEVGEVAHACADAARHRVAVAARRPHRGAAAGRVPRRPRRGDVAAAQPRDAAAGRRDVRAGRRRARLPQRASRSRSWRARTTCCAPA